MARQESVRGANMIPAGEVTTNTVNGKREHRGNASNDNEPNVFAKSRSGLNDESGSSVKEDEHGQREKDGRSRNRGGPRGVPVTERDANGADGEN